MLKDRVNLRFSLWYPVFRILHYNYYYYNYYIHLSKKNTKNSVLKVMTKDLKTPILRCVQLAIHIATNLDLPGSLVLIFYLVEFLNIDNF